MEKSDKQLMREGNYQEALGDNYVSKPIYLMVFENGDCTDHLDVEFYTIQKAKEWIDENKHKKKEGQEWFFGNKNSDWL